MSIEALTKLAERLQYYNDCRRGAETEQPNATQIGQDIDAAIEVIKAVIEEAEENEE